MKKLEYILIALFGITLSFFISKIYNFLKEIIDYIIENFNTLLPHIKSTLFVSLSGLFISIILAIFIAIILDFLSTFKKIFIPLIYLSQLFPTIVLAPIYVILFGYTLIAKILVVISCCFFPIVINLINSLKTNDIDEICLIYNLGGNKFDVIKYVKFPNSFKALIAGVKISSSFCIGSALVGEWLGGESGLGIVMIIAKKSFNYEGLYACTFIVVFLSIILILLVKLVEIFLIKRRIL